MPIQQWSEGIWLVELANEPQLSDDMSALIERLEDGQAANVVLNFGAVTHINSTNISQLLQVRQRVSRAGRELRLCSVRDAVWSIMLVTGIGDLLDFSPDVPSALASLQLEQ